MLDRPATRACATIEQEMTMAFAKPSNLLPRLVGGKEKYTDTNEFLSAGVLVAFKKRPGHPSPAVKLALNNAAVQARNIVRIANDEMAKVVIQRKKEPAWFTAAMERHFNLRADGDLAGGLLVENKIDKDFSIRDLFKHDRRWALEQIRQNMLSLSFHLNTSMYLVDQDVNNRTVMGGNKTTAQAVFGANAQYNEAYVYQHSGGKNSLCGFRNGEIHTEFDIMPTYTLNSGARILVHEAAHKFLNVGDTFYAHSPNYPPSLMKCLTDNADSYAWTALSLATKGLKMDTDGSGDWQNCPGAKL